MVVSCLFRHIALLMRYYCIVLVDTVEREGGEVLGVRSWETPKLHKEGVGEMCAQM